MQLKTLFYVKNNPYIGRYLREYSSWYKTLNRNPKSIEWLEREMKEMYHLTPQDKIQELGRRIEMLRNFIDLLN